MTLTVLACGGFHLMLELSWIARVHWDGRAVDMKFAYDRAAALQLRAVGVVGALAQAQQPHQDILLRILVRQERLPATVRRVVTADQLHLVGHSRTINVILCDKTDNSLKYFRCLT